MLLIVLLAILTIVFGWISYALLDAFGEQIVFFVALVLAIASGVCAVVFGATALAYRIGYKADKISAETRIRESSTRLKLLNIRMISRKNACMNKSLHGIRM